MRNRVKFLLVLVLLVSFFGGVKAQDYTLYYTIDEMPDACIFLPPPPAFESLAYVDDFEQWQWGKSMRATERGKMASRDSEYSMGCVTEIFGKAMDMEITPEGTPAIWRLMYRVGETAHHSVVKAKNKYMRTRPFAKMNEHVAGEYDDEEGLRGNGSYPSGHTAFGWSIALALAEMAPEQQDAILRRGYQYGESRVIVGAHWQSDVEAARLAMAAAMARLHTNKDFLDDLAAARTEYREIKGIDKKSRVTGYPDGRNIMDAPVDTASRRYYADVAQYWLAKTERDTERGLQAMTDADDSETALMSCFAPCMEMNLSKRETPHIAALMSYSRAVFMSEAARMKDADFRKRPYVQLGEPTLLPDDEESNAVTSSYPSTAAAAGWGLALVLSELAPEHQDMILRRGYEYGRSRVIAGYHFASDVLAGRIMASYVFTQLHNDPEFVRLMEKARKDVKR